MKKFASFTKRKFGFVRLLSITAVVLTAAIFINALPNLTAQAASNSSFFGLSDFFGWSAPAPAANQLTAEDPDAPQVVGSCDVATAALPIEVESSLPSGPTAYATLKAAFDAINAGTHQGAVNVEVCFNSTSEAAAAVLNSSGVGGTIYTSVSVRPLADGLTISGAGSGGGRGLIELNGADNVTIDGDNPNTAGTNRNLTITSTSIGTYHQVIRVALAITGTGITTADNNTFRNLNINGGATGRNTSLATSTTGTENTTYGIYASAGATATVPALLTSTSTTIGTGATANNLTIQNNAINTTARAVAVQGAATTVFPGLLIENNNIGNPTAGDVNQVYSFGATVQGSTNAILRNNTTYVESFLGTSIRGLDNGSISANGNGTIFERNRVNRVRSNSTGGFGSYGISLAGGNTHIVRNNFVSNVINVANATFSTTFGAFGIRVASGTGHQVYFNSVNMNGVLTGTGSALTAALAIAATGQTGVDVRNNIFANSQSGGAATSAYASIFLPSGGTSAMNLTLNNNAYFEGPNALNAIAQVGTTFGTGVYKAANFNPASTTPATNLRAYTSTLSAAGTNDDASVASSAAPPFVSDTDLHIDGGAASATLIDGKATPIAGISTDIDNQTRNAFTPDIGADEFNLVIAAGTLQFASAAVTANEGATVTITVNRTAGSTGTVTAQVSITGGTATGGAACGAGVDYINTGFPQTLTFVGGDTSESFNVTLCPDAVLDNNETIIFTLSSPTGGATIGAINTTTVTINDVPPPLSGTYTVPGSFPSLTNPGGIFEALNISGASSAITINITADLTGESGAVALNPVAGGFSVLIKPSGGAQTITSTTTAFRLLAFIGADNVTVDGSLSGGTDRSLTLTMANTTSSGTVTVFVGSQGTGAGANNFTLKNTTVNGGSASPAGTLTTFGIFVGDQTGAANGADNDNLTIQNNLVQRALIGLQAIGVAATGINDNTNISGNTFGGAAAADFLGRVGINIGQTTNSTVSINTVRNMLFTGAADVQAITVGAGSTNTRVTRNEINNLEASNVGGYGSTGVSVATGTAASNITVDNNFIYDIRGTSYITSVLTDTNAGIRVVTSGTGGVNIYYNSVNLFGSYAGFNGATISSGLLIAAGVTGLDIRDNAFVNSSDNTTVTTDKNYAIYSASANTAFTTINYNDYFVGGAQGVLGAINSTDATTLAALQAATGQDVNSQSVDPLFVSPTDLHLQSGSPLRNIGTPIAGITTDNDGDTRDATPDIGADEFISLAGTLNFGSATYSGNEGTSVTITVERTAGSLGVVTAQVSITGGTATGGAACGAGVDYINTGFPQTLTFASGDTSESFNVTLCGDGVLDDNETIIFGLSSPTGGATIGAINSTTVTINDVPPGVLQFSSATYSGNENTPVTITVNRTSGDAGTVTAQVSITGGTATGGAACGAGVDYINTGFPQTLTFVNGDVSESFNVTLCPDAVTDANETIIFGLSNPTGGATIGAINTTTVTINDVAPPLNGTYTVPGNFPSLTNPGGIFEALNNSGASGTVNINITANLTGETGSVALNALAGSPAVNIRPTGGSYTITSTPTADTLIGIIGADNVTIDGNDQTTPAVDRGLTFNLTNTTTSGTTVFFIASQGTGAGATNFTLQNSTVQAGVNGSDGVLLTFGIFVGSQTGAANGADNDNLTIQNNLIQRATIGIQAVGVAGAVNNNTVIVDNTLGGAVAADFLGLVGINVGQADNARITRNTVNNIVSSDASDVRGIILGAGTLNSSVTRNRITNLNATNTGGYGSVGIFVGTNTTASGITVANNFVSDIRGTSYTTGTFIGDTNAGIMIAGTTGGVGIYYNSVNLFGDYAGFNGATITGALSIINSTVTDLNVRDNIFVNSFDNTTVTSDKNYAIYSAAPAASFTNINYNDYFVSGPQGVLGAINAVDVTTLAALQVATGKDASSISADPLFVSPTDLHISAGSPVINAGTPIAGITVDFDNQTRSATAPEIGADEFFAPTAASVDVGGRIREANGRGIFRARVTMTDAGGNVRMAFTNQFGHFHFDSVAAGNTYVFSATHRRYQFTEPTQVQFISEATEGINFTASGENPGFRPGATFFDNAPFDFDGDGRTDVSVFRSSDNTWYINRSSDNTLFAQAFGAAGDRLAPADFDGDGKTDLAVYRPSEGNWYVWLSASNSLRVEQFGTELDRAIPADFDGDGKADFSIWNEMRGTWQVKLSTNGTIVSERFTNGKGNFTPLASDRDGDGKADFIFFNNLNATWTIRTSSGANIKEQFGAAGDRAATGDFDGDAQGDLAVYRASENTWIIKLADGKELNNLRLSANADNPALGDFDGDGKADAAGFGGGIWAIRQSVNGAVRQQQFGLADDTVIPSVR